MKWLNTRGGSVLTIAICDRCKMKRAYDDIQQDGNIPGLRVCKFGCSDVKDPYRLPMRQPEKISVRFPRPDEPVGTPSELPINTTGVDLLSKQTPYTEDKNINQTIYKPS